MGGGGRGGGLIVGRLRYFLNNIKDAVKNVM